MACAACGAPAAQPQARRSARADLYDCEGCDGAYERPSTSMDWRARIAAPDEPGDRLQITGTLLQADRRTPAPGVIIYAYHTDAAGLYSRGTPETEWSRRHGLLRGWIRTGQDGRYAFDTIKPTPYPNQRFPAHVHLTVLEPGKRPYWIDDIVFSGEFGVTEAYRRERENRGGNGIVALTRRNGTWLARRDIVLEPHPI
jgi:protocatechuate 3,4-dioxygenase beta subunit